MVLQVVSGLGFMETVAWSLKMVRGMGRLSKMYGVSKDSPVKGPHSGAWNYPP